MDQESFVKQGLSNIQKTNQILNQLQSRLNNYIHSKSRQSQFIKESYQNIYIPSIQLNFSSLKNSQSPPMKLQNEFQVKQSKLLQEQEQQKVQENLEKELKYYENKFSKSKSNIQLNKIQQFYINRTELLQERIKQLEQKKLKIKSQKALLIKDNQNLYKRIQNEKQNLQIIINNQISANQLKDKKKKMQTQQKIMQLKKVLQKQKLIQQNLLSQKSNFQISLKLLLQSQKNAVRTDINQNQKKLKKSNSARFKSKSNLIKRFGNNTSSQTNVPANRHRDCCPKFDNIKKSKSRSTILK